MITHTVHNVKMSPRTSRLWTFIREERKIQLTDWSTDEAVEVCQGALREGEKVLVERAAKAPDDQSLANLLADYRTVMNRRPHGRVTAQSLREGEARARAARAEVHADDDDEIQAKIMRGGQ